MQHRGKSVQGQEAKERFRGNVGCQQAGLLMLTI